MRSGNSYNVVEGNIPSGRLRSVAESRSKLGKAENCVKLKNLF